MLNFALSKYISGVCEREKDGKEKVGSSRDNNNPKKKEEKHQIKYKLKTINRTQKQKVPQHF